MTHTYAALVHRNSYYNTNISDMLLEVHKTSSTEEVKGYRLVLNHVISLTSPDLTASEVISRIFSSFEKSCLPKEVRLPE